MKKWWFGLFLFLFVAGVIARILHFPFRESAVLRVIPADALLMSQHAEPGSRWTEALEEGVLDPWLQLAGMESNHPGKELLEDPGVVWLLSTLGNRYVATAYVDRFKGQLMPAWIASAWVGGRFTHLARMGFLDDAFPDFDVVQMDNGVRIWRGYFPDLPRGHEHVSFGVYEGVAFGVATDHPFGAVQLHEVMRRQSRSASKTLFSEGWALLGDLPDLLRFHTPVGPFRASISFTEVSGGLRMYVAPEEEGIVHAHGSLSTIAADLLSMVEPTAVTVLGTTAGNALRTTQSVPLPNLVRDVVQLLFTHASGREESAAFVAWVASREHSGRVMRLRVPAAGAALEVLPNVSAMEILTPILQRLQTHYGLSWRAVPYGQRGVLSLTPPQHDWYANLPRGERVGVAVWNGFFWIHSSASALDSLLAHFRHHAGLDPFPLPEDARWYMRLDGSSVGEIVQMGVSSYALWQVGAGQRRNREREAWLQRLAKAIATYDYAEAIVQVHAEGNILVVEIVPQDPNS